MSIWEAILKALEQLSPDDEFGLLKKGFRWEREDGSLEEVGLTEMVQSLTRRLVSDGCVSRRMRELAKRECWKRFNVRFEYEVVRRGWYRITRLEPVHTEPANAGTNTYTPPAERVIFQPVEGPGGELRLF